MDGVDRGLQPMKIIIDSLAEATRLEEALETDDINPVTLSHRLSVYTKKQ